MSYSNQVSDQLFDKAKNILVGGVNSPVRNFGYVGGNPIFMKKGEGSKLWDEDGNVYCDYVSSWGATILGHAHPLVLEDIISKLRDGLGFGTPTSIETILAEQIQKTYPLMEKIRLVSSGTEACMSAIRLAKGYTGRAKIIKFSGAYHGHADFLLAKAGSGSATFSIPTSAGITPRQTEDTLLAPFNDFAKIEALFKDQGNDIAALILEPICGNAGFIRPEIDFLQKLATICKKNGALLIFDEVMTGYRVAKGGVQSLYGIQPDLTTLGKIVGGGLPLAAYGGRKEIMSHLAPEGNVYQAGTLSGNPVCAASGLKTLQLLDAPNFYENISKMTKTLMEGFKDIAKKHQVPLTVDYEGGMFGFFFSNQPIKSFEEAQSFCNKARFQEFFHAMLKRGFYFAPSPFEAGFVSSAHTSEDIQNTLNSCDEVMAKFAS